MFLTVTAEMIGPMWPLRRSSTIMVLWGASPVPVAKKTTVSFGSLTGARV